MKVGLNTILVLVLSKCSFTSMHFQLLVFFQHFQLLFILVLVRNVHFDPTVFLKSDKFRPCLQNLNISFIHNGNLSYKSMATATVLEI